MYRFVSYRGCARALCASAGAALFATFGVAAEVVEFAGFEVDVDATVVEGSGENASILVIDWDTFGGPYETASHAFLYRWEGSATLLDMLNAFQNEGVFTFTGSSFLSNIAYTDADGDTHLNPVNGNWELASGTNALGQWDGFDLSNPDWAFNVVGLDQEVLADGQFEGINAAFFDPADNFNRVGTALSVPLVPEPSSAALLGLAGLALIRRRRSV